VQGFGLRVTAAGARSFVLRYRVRGSGRNPTFTIVKATIWRVTEARAEAKRLRQFIDQGGDPSAEVEAQRKAPTMAALCDRFEAEHLPRKRPSTAADYRRLLKNHIRPFFGPHSKVSSVRFEDCQALHTKITRAGSPYAANRSMAVLSKMLNLAVRWRMRESNPCKGVERNTEHSRRRYLSGDELGRLVAALNAHADQQAADIIRVLLLSGCRKGEALAMRWADVDLREGLWSKPPSSTKQKQHHESALSAPACALLSRIRESQTAKRRPLGEFVFPGPGATGHRVELKKGWRQLCKAAGIGGLRLHDLRHSYASALISAGASLPLVGAMLGHASPQTTQRYAHMFCVARPPSASAR